MEFRKCEYYRIYRMARCVMMPCFVPLKGYRWDDGTVKFRRPPFGDASLITVGCSQCGGCRMDRARQWAARCVHENQVHGEVGQFLTLTYDDKYLPHGEHLVYADFQDFMKRVRKDVGPGLRFFMCGEYGKKKKRPHYHALFFNHAYEDLVLCEETEYGNLYQSADLFSHWRRGNALVGALTFRSASYVARYNMKTLKAYRDLPDRPPEFIQMSRRPGIGRAWWNKYRKLTHDYVVVDGVKLKTPKYYDKLMEEEFPDEFREMKYRRAEGMARSNEENSYRRLMMREEHFKLTQVEYERMEDERSVRDL